MYIYPENVFAHHAKKVCTLYHSQPFFPWKTVWYITIIKLSGYVNTFSVTSGRSKQFPATDTFDCQEQGFLDPSL